MLPREFAIHRKLDHENIIKMLDYFEDERNFYLVMEKPESVIELYYHVLNHSGLSEKLSQHYFRQVANAVQYCHSVGVVHHDIKLDNILIDLDTKQAKLIDFGRASFLCKKTYTKYEGEANDTFFHVAVATPLNITSLNA